MNTGSHGHRKGVCGTSQGTSFQLEWAAMFFGEKRHVAPLRVPEVGKLSEMARSVPSGALER